jgi:hypothetical protein
VTAQIDMYLRLIKNRLEQIAEIDKRQDVAIAVDEAWDKIEKLEIVLKGTTDGG